jgi:hypothetical protein
LKFFVGPLRIKKQERDLAGTNMGADGFIWDLAIEFALEVLLALFEVLLS